MEHSEINKIRLRLLEYGKKGVEMFEKFKNERITKRDNKMNYLFSGKEPAARRFGKLHELFFPDTKIFFFATSNNKPSRYSNRPGLWCWTYHKSIGIYCRIR